MKLAEEQLKIIEMATEIVPEEQFSLDGGRLINAPGVAGAGKSAIIVELARRDAIRRILFLSQSRNICDRARATLPENVMAMTVQEAAHRFLFYLYERKLRARPVQASLTDEQMLSAAGVGTTRQEIRRARQVLYHFYRSTNGYPETGNLPKGTRGSEQWVHNPSESGRVLKVARDIWFSQCGRDPSSAPLTYAAEVKLWTQSGTEQVRLDGPSRMKTVSPLHKADLVILEEAQDADEAQLGMLARQNISVVMFGDGFQSLRNGNRLIQAQRHPLQERAATVHMPRSYRYGPSIAGVLNALTHRAGSGNRDRVIGCGQSNIYPLSQRLLWENTGKHYAFIAVSVATLFDEALAAERRGRTIAWVDGLESYPVALLRDLVILASPRLSLASDRSCKQQVASPVLLGVNDLDQAREHFKQRWDSLGTELCEWVQRQAFSEPHLLDVIEGWRESDERRQRALLSAGELIPERDITLSTVTRAKGHEWPRVAVAEDCFPSPLITGKWILDKSHRVMANHAYTALSRASHALAIPESFLGYLSAHQVVLPENSFADGEEIVRDEKVHPYFGVQRLALLEMKPSLRRQRVVPKKPRPPSLRSSGQNQVRDQIEEQAAALGQFSVDELRTMLRPRRGKGKAIKKS
ncbi:ATP-binding domain-containing protein [Halomonas sp. BN3-1]|uniref:ATP-binding domain-containing protein n=1 Tax=Halomonas sp. BN3-1 TaxID=2082393 RepID=UPI0013B42490|nr:ATP-binding domain-containing protein [Halomonas sp. BN3-1]